MATQAKFEKHPYNYTATGALGVGRDTMFGNFLHSRDKVGRSRKLCCYPAVDGATYGMPGEGRLHTVADALHGWPRDKYFMENLPPKNHPRDFEGLNCGALTGGMISAPENYMYRATHDIRKVTKVRERKSKSLWYPPDMVFGISTRPSTPIYDLIEHKFQDQWLKERREAELARRKSERLEKINSKAVNQNRTTKLRVFQQPVEDEPLWQMAKFTRNARPHLQTFRKAKSESDAIAGHRYDKISRRGKDGQGIYEAAKS